MKEAFIIAAAAFVISYLGLSLVVWLLHRLTKTDRSYRLGILVFALLVALYSWSSSLGRR
jgi:hypothetical protein